MTPQAPPVTVVVPARNASATIDAQLDALCAQDYQGHIAVVVADNGSSDDTVTRVQTWNDRLSDLRIVVANDRQGAAHARNVGIAAAVTDIVLCCDADDIVDPGWVRHLSAALASTDAVAGGTLPFRGPPPPTADPPTAFGTAGFAFLPAMSGASCGFHRAAWDAIGGFDEELAVSCEDLDFAWRLQLAGGTLAQAPEGFVHYREPDTPRATFRRWYRYGLVQPVLLARFRDSGLRREPTRRTLVGWARLALHAYRLAGSDAARCRWCRDAGRRLGRLVGSVRFRSWFP